MEALMLYAVALFPALFIILFLAGAVIGLARAAFEALRATSSARKSATESKRCEQIEHAPIARPAPRIEVYEEVSGPYATA